MPAKKKTKKAASKMAKTAKATKKTVKRIVKAKTKKVTARKEIKEVQAVRPEELVDCTHCDGTGKCAAGQPYDKMHHQGVFARVRLTSCLECLEAAGEHRNSKKLVDCRFCKGTGKVEKPKTS